MTRARLALVVAAGAFAQACSQPAILEVELSACDQASIPAYDALDVTVSANGIVGTARYPARHPGLPTALTATLLPGQSGVLDVEVIAREADAGVASSGERPAGPAPTGAVTATKICLRPGTPDGGPDGGVPDAALDAGDASLPADAASDVFTDVSASDVQPAGDMTCPACSTVIVLANRQPDPVAIALDDTTVYWANLANLTGAGEINAYDIDRSRPVFSYAQSLGLPCSIAASGGTVFWGVQDMDPTGSGQTIGALYRSSNPLADPELLTPDGQAAPCSIALYGQYLFWANQSDNLILRMALAPFPQDPMIIATEQSTPDSVAAEDAVLYWTTQGAGAGDGEVKRLPQPFDGGVPGTPTAIATDQSLPHSTSVYDGQIYWISGGSILRAPIDGTSAETVISGQDHPSAVAVDASGVYWLNVGAQSMISDEAAGKGSLMRLTAGANMPELMANRQNSPRALVLNATDVYWINEGTFTAGENGGDGEVLRIAK